MSLEHVKADAPPDEIVEVLGEDGGVIVEGLQSVRPGAEVKAAEWSPPASKAAAQPAAAK